MAEEFLANAPALLASIAEDDAHPFHGAAHLLLRVMNAMDAKIATELDEATD